MTLLYEAVFPLATLLTLAVCIWRFTSMMTNLTGMAGRFSERNEQQRDRFYERMIEKQQVEGDPERAVQLAGMHHSESVNNHRSNLNRDARADRAVAVEVRHRAQPAVVGHEMDAQQ